MALEVTDGNFEELVLKSDQPVIIDFWVAWWAQSSKKWVSIMMVKH